MITREQGQRMVVEHFARYGRLLVLYPTGFGKAKAALDAVTPFSQGEWKGMIVCHSQNARDYTWPTELNKWSPDLNGRGRLELVCYHSLNKYVGYEYDWVICDEGHYLTLDRAGFFDRNRVHRVLIMTATMPDEPEKVDILRKLTGGRRLQINLGDAINAGVLNDYRVSVWMVDLTDEERLKNAQLSEKVMRAMQVNRKDLINLAAGERMRFIYNLETKRKAALYLRDQIRMTGKRFVIFAGSIEMANQLSPYRYHSQVDDTDFLRFCRGEIDELVSIKQIQEGNNIHNLQSGLVAQVNSKERNLLQKLGRFLRLPEGEIAKIHVLCAKYTKDQDWTASSVQSLDKNKVTWRQLDRDLFDHY